MFKKLSRTFFIVNKHKPENLDKVVSYEICKDPALSSVASHSENFTGSKFYDAIAKDNRAFEIYRKIVPYAVLARHSLQKFVYVVKANYLKDLKTIEFLAMDSAGFYKLYVDLEFLIPATWDEFCKELPLNVEWSDEVDHNMIFKHAKQNEFYFFAKNCEWNEETANLSDFDFRSLFKEEEWLEDSIYHK